VYDEWSVRHLPKAYIDKYTIRRNGGFEVSDELKKMVEFVPLNLNDIESWVTKRGFFFDIIFCRNVLMYFSQDRARAVVDGFAKVLRRGGFLFVASTESVTRHSDLFAARKIEGSFIYEKV
jgi:chemotaxis protein methyltransferase CheR